MQIILRNYTKIIKRIKILDDINLSFEDGKIYGINGENGSGKTMLMRAIAGLIRPNSGTVEIDGKILFKDISFPESLGILIETPGFISKYSGYKNLLVISSLKKSIGTNEICETLKRVGLDPLDKRAYHKYSLGMKQRLGVACAIMEHPKIILLDEPTNALDEEGVGQIRDIVIEEKNAGALIIIACHDKEILGYLSDEIISIHAGKILEKNVHPLTY